MAGMVRGKALDFAQVMRSVREVLEQLPDARRGKNLHYRMVDAGLSAAQTQTLAPESIAQPHPPVPGGAGRADIAAAQPARAGEGRDQKEVLFLRNFCICKNIAPDSKKPPFGGL